MSLQPVRFVLFQPSHPGNIGAVARAMKTMGFDELVLVDPRADIDGEARARSSGAADLLSSAGRVDSLEDALAGCSLVIGASARRRRLSWPEMNPRECAAAVNEARGTKPVAIVFGPERAGLTNAELDRCNALVYIPSNPDYNSLNLAAAVQIIAYELRVAKAADVIPDPSESPTASAEQMEMFYEHLQQVLLASGFLKADNPRHLMRRLRRLFNRSGLDEIELSILRGILSSVDPASGRDNADD